MRPPLLMLSLLMVACAPSQAAGPLAMPLPAADLRLPAPAHTLDQSIDLELRLDHLSHGDLPDGAPSVVVHAPAGLRPEDASVVVYLHGWAGCARAIVSSQDIPCADGEAPTPGWGLAARHDEAGTNSVLVVPQLAWLANSGRPGHFSDPAFSLAWLDELTERALAPLGLTQVQDMVIVAHSGGYVTTLELLASDLPVGSVVLLDALYGGGNVVAQWLVNDPRRRAVSLHTPNASTTGQSHLLGERVAAQLGAQHVATDPPSLGDAIRDHSVVVAQSPHGHGAIPAAHLSEVLAALPLTARGDGLAER